MIASNHNHPVVCFAETGGDAVKDDVIVAWLFKSKPTVTGNDKLGVCQLIVDAHLVYHFFEVTVNVSANNNVPSIWK